MLNRMVLAAVAAASLAAPLAASAQDWDHDGHGGGYEQGRGGDNEGWRDHEHREHEHDEWRDHERGEHAWGERREWREREAYRPVYRTYSYYAPHRVYHHPHCWRETRRVGRHTFEVVTRCRR